MEKQIIKNVIVKSHNAKITKGLTIRGKKIDLNTPVQLNSFELRKLVHNPKVAVFELNPFTGDQIKLNLKNYNTKNYTAPVYTTEDGKKVELIGIDKAADEQIDDSDQNADN